MYELSQPAKMVQDMVRQWCRKNLMPALPALERGEILPYDLCRDLLKQTGMDVMIRAAILKRVEKLREAEAKGVRAGSSTADLMGDGDEAGDPILVYVILKELARCSPGFAMTWGVMLGLSGGALIGKGNAAQVEKYALPAVTMQKVSSWCLTEPGAGSDAFGSMRTTAKPDGDHYVLNGSKMFITNAPYADIFVVYAKVDRGQPRAEMAVNAFICERGMPGLSTGQPLKKMGMKDSPTGEVFLDNVRVHKDNLLGGVEKTAEGRLDTKESLGNERSGLPALALGVIEECYERCVAYVKQREQFGKPIAEYQAVQLKIADMYSKMKIVESTLFRTAWMQKKGIKDPAFINSSKAYCSEMASQVAATAIQIHGGYGYMEEYHIEKLARDCKLLELGGGTTDINMLSAARLELGLA
jgi:alkylation response protein AidB-like acyl-CoA dehydrogenase